MPGLTSLLDRQALAFFCSFRSVSNIFFVLNWSLYLIFVDKHYRYTFDRYIFDGELQTELMIDKVAKEKAFV